ncbi:MAG: hypothetical protein PUE01_03365 [Clostridiaceae bacterium]|nr:hypothetical protein [Clostridiaceae bacterium]
MFKTFINSFNVSFVEGANTSIYYLRKIPIIGKKIPERIYAETDGKIIYGIIKLILAFFGQFVRKGIYLGLFIWLPAELMVGKFPSVNKEELMLQGFVLLNMILGSIINSKILESDKNLCVMIKFLRVNPKKYYLGQLVFKVLSQFIYFIPGFLIIGFDIKATLMLLVELSAFRMIFEVFVIAMFKKYDYVLNEHTGFSLFCMLIPFLIAYLPACFNITFGFAKIVYNPIFMVIVFTVGAICTKFIFSYNGYTAISRRMAKMSSLVDGEVQEDLNFADVKINEKKLNSKLLDTRKFENKSGYDYLNSIFFYRNNKIVQRSMLTKSCIIVVTFIGIVIATFTVLKGKNVENFEALINSGPLFVFIMYTLCSAERLCKAMFYNCDLSLLNYNFYKTPKAILNNFTCRLKRVLVIINLPVVLLVASISAYVFIIGKQNEFIKIVPLLVLIMVLGIFFSMYSLFMYYIIQPYTKDLKVKSPVFSGANTLMYLLCFVCLKIKAAPTYFTLGVIIVTLLFTPISLYCIYKYAPKTFKIK